MTKGNGGLAAVPSFLPFVMSTPGRIHGEFLWLLDIVACCCTVSWLRWTRKTGNTVPRQAPRPSRRAAARGEGKRLFMQDEEAAEERRYDGGALLANENASGTCKLTRRSPSTVENGFPATPGEIWISSLNPATTLPPQPRGLLARARRPWARCGE